MQPQWIESGCQMTIDLIGSNNVRHGQGIGWNGVLQKVRGSKNERMHFNNAKREKLSVVRASCARFYNSPINDNTQQQQQQQQCLPKLCSLVSRKQEPWVFDREIHRTESHLRYYRNIVSTRDEPKLDLARIVRTFARHTNWTCPSRMFPFHFSNQEGSKIRKVWRGRNEQRLLLMQH
jgi:hypothetical protein